MNGRMRADRHTAAVTGHSCRESAEAAEEAEVELANQIDGLRQQADDLRVEIEMAMSVLSTVVTNLSAAATGAVMQLQSIGHRAGLMEQPETSELESEPQSAPERSSDLTSRASSNGDAKGYPKRSSLAQRLDNYTVTGAGCHEWNGPRSLDGYGMLTVMLPVGNRRRSVHRLAWKVANGEIPHGKQVRHRCGNRSCINVEHLELVAVDRPQSRPGTRMISDVRQN